MTKKITKEVFLERAVAKHGGKYCYDDIDFVKIDIKIDILCNRCGKTFPQAPRKHMIGQGCPRSSCGGTQKLTHEEFVENARKKHGQRYSYPEKYIDAKTEIDIICNKCMRTIHLSPNTHTSSAGGGCSFCNGGGLSNTEDFIIKAKRSHSEGHYSYDKFVYVEAKIDGLVYCNVHNEYFECAPYNHLSGFKDGKLVRKGTGCDKCGREKTINGSLKGLKYYLDRFRETHGDRYEYDTDSYSGVKKSMNMYCYDHGWFPQRPDDHYHAKQGCPDCGIESRSRLKMLTKKDLMKRIWAYHGRKYQYDLSNFVYAQDYISIKCKEHGWFPQAAYNHYYSKSGCPKCKSSKGEKLVRNILNSIGVNFEEQQAFDECRNIRKLPFDFSIFSKSGELKGLIEYQGHFHTMVIDRFENETDNYFNRQKRDQIKYDFCKYNKIPFLALYHDNENIEEALKLFLKRIRTKKPITDFKQPGQLSIFQG